MKSQNNGKGASSKYDYVQRLAVAIFVDLELNLELFSQDLGKFTSTWFFLLNPTSTRLLASFLTFDNSVHLF